MKRKYKSALLVVFLFALGAAASCFLAAAGEQLLVSDEFLITFTGVVLGLATTIVTFLFASTDKVWAVIDRNYTDKEKAVRMQKLYKSGLRELLADGKYVFILFLAALLFAVLGAVDLPLIAFPSWLSKAAVLDALKLGLLFNCTAAICDLFLSLFNLLKLALYEK